MKSGDMGGHDLNYKYWRKEENGFWENGDIIP
jgi:hypothetical protein